MFWYRHYKMSNRFRYGFYKNAFDRKSDAVKMFNTKFPDKDIKKSVAIFIDASLDGKFVVSTNEKNPTILFKSGKTISGIEAENFISGFSKLVPMNEIGD